MKEWKDWLANFKAQYGTKQKVKFTYVPNAAALLNDLYWRLVEQYLRPILKLENEKEEEHRIHPYKIISASEIAVMMVEPIQVKGNLKVEKRLNASLAWFIATQIMEGWETGSPVKITTVHISETAKYKEHIESNKRYPESSPESFFITNTSSPSIEKLLSHKDKLWEHNIKPANAGTLNRLISAFQNVFKNFKAKN